MFFCCLLLRVHPSQIGFCSSTALLAMVLAYQRLESLQISHSPFFFFAFALAYIPCVDSGFQSAVPVMAFTTASFTCWLSPPSSYPQQFRHFVCFQSSAGPNLFSGNPSQCSDRPNLFSGNPSQCSDRPSLFSDNPSQCSDKPNKS